MRFGLPEEVIHTICGILQRYPQVDQAILYGSRAKGVARAGSDVDLTLVGTTVTHQTLLRIASDLDDSFIPYRVDLSVLGDIVDPAVRDHIHRYGVVFYQRDAAPITP
jgi:predicted nucleotidyltransferase